MMGAYRALLALPLLASSASACFAQSRLEAPTALPQKVLGDKLQKVRSGMEANQVRIPADVLKLAKTYLALHPDEVVLGPDKPVDVYAKTFFDAFLYPRGISTSSNLRKEAYAQGQARAQEGQAARERTFAGFGYERIELTGVWSVSFEQSSFAPDGSEGGYWLEFLPGGHADLPKPTTQDLRHPAELHIHIVAYRSPAGRYGHLGIWQRQLYVESSKLAAE